ncbi:MAG TPA: molecular chaperone DnaJ [Verrucomicrobiales bacterium]|nr:molecular chaperone DnaJ [Verrucomicrobiales bacterium]
MSESVERFQKMLEQNPGNNLARFSLGKALFDAGRFAEAKGHLVEALARKPDWMLVQILIGKCELALGDRAAARASFRRGLELAVAQHHEGPQAEMESALADLEG